MTQTLELLLGEVESMQSRIDIDASTIAQQQAEVARLREDRDYCALKADEATRAHEATKAELHQTRVAFVEAAEKAAARVAFLENELSLGGPVLPEQSGVPVYDPSCHRCRECGKRCGICMHYVDQQDRRDAEKEQGT